MQLSPAVERYVLHWGEMGTRWGTNRTVAQIQALLYLSPEPLRADQIVDALSVARSNVSTSIRELQSYGLVRMTHILGDRRDYFESLHDVWELFRVIIEQRKQRELNPTLSMLRAVAEEVEQEPERPARGAGHSRKEERTEPGHHLADLGQDLVAIGLDLRPEG